ncbi:SCO6745 family protein [Streptomyces sp. TR06-5]|uniref:SCO6745 family protein n=1 Tax=unclassified Streptomyces TaxID=2593676 RepID=UPI0039A069EC
MTDFPSLARSVWHHLEPVHACVYFSTEAEAESEAVGYGTAERWPRYFAWRTAPLGAAGPGLTAAAYYSFSPDRIARYVPAVWDTAPPEQALASRLRAVDATLRRLLGGRVDDPGLARAAELARSAAEAADTAGRPLAAAQLDLDWPTEPHLVLWHAATVLREHRGDGHIAALQAAGLDGCEALVSFAAVGAAPVENFSSRGWAPDAWTAARERLAARGWLDDEGRATERGRSGRERVERMTDELAAGPYRALGSDGCARLTELCGPVCAAVLGAGMLPTQSTLGILTVATPGPRS